MRHYVRTGFHSFVGQELPAVAPLGFRSKVPKFFRKINKAIVIPPPESQTTYDIISLPFDVPVPPRGFQYEIVSFATWYVSGTSAPGSSGITAFADALKGPFDPDWEPSNYVRPNIHQYRLDDSVSSDIKTVVVGSGRSWDLGQNVYNEIGIPSFELSAEKNFLPISPGHHEAKLTVSVSRWAKNAPVDRRLITVISDASILVTLRLVKIPSIVDFTQPFQGQPQTSVPFAQARPGIAIPVYRGVPAPIVFPPVQPGTVPPVEVLNAIPQNGLSMSRSLRFGQRFSALPRVDNARLPPVAPIIQNVPSIPGRDIGDPVSPAIPRVNRYEKQYYGPGLYRITVPGGLRAAVPDTREGTRPIGNLAVGMTIQVVEDLGNSWLRISSPFFGFVQVPPEGGLISVSPGAVPLYDGLRYPSVTPRRYSRAMIGQERIDSFNGPGMYRVTSPIGLNVHQQTARSSFAYGVVKQGWDVEVLRDAGNGWFEVRANVEWFKWQDPPSGIPQQRRDNPERIGPVTGYICGSCAENPIGPGPWLVPISAGGASHPAPAPYVLQYRVPVSALRFPRAIPARAGMIGQNLLPSRRRGAVG